MVERFHDVDALFRHNLALAASMENDSLTLLSQLEQAAREEKLKALFRDHAEETREQIANVERCFELIGAKLTDSSCGATQAMASETSTTLRKTDDLLFDTVALSAALQTEHFEIGTYVGLIITADAHALPGVSELLRANLEQEKSAADKLRAAAEGVAQTEAGKRKQAKESSTQEPDPWS